MLPPTSYQEKPGQKGLRIGKLMMFMGYLPFLGLFYHMLLLPPSSVPPPEIIWTYLSLCAFMVPLHLLARKIDSGSQKTYVATLVVVALAIDVNMITLLQGRVLSPVIICLGAIILIYLAHRDVRGYFFPDLAVPAP